jgi:hypothetical protein
MAEKSAKKKTKKATKAAADEGVLGNLRSTRPTRLGGQRRASTTGAAATKTRTATKPAAAGSGGAPKSRGAARSSRAAATKAGGAAAARSTSPKAGGAAKARSSRPTAPPAGWQTPGQDSGRKSGPPSGADLVTTTVQAVGELAQIGATLTGRLLKRAADRLPRP